ncbi:hypothetical protein EV145_112121 [Flavobacterium sp. 245]|nr:hypothetical protein EV145_112121 [Flavobacterium sp. 245]
MIIADSHKTALSPNEVLFYSGSRPSKLEI